MYKKLFILFSIAILAVGDSFCMMRTANSNPMVKPDLIVAAINQNKKDKQQKKKETHSKDGLKSIMKNQIDAIKKQNPNINKNILGYQSNKNGLRIATYNVNRFKNLSNNVSFDHIYNVLKDINADVVILQEVEKKADTENKFKNLGYKHIAFARGPLDPKKPNIGNMILSKYQFLGMPITKNFKSAQGIHERSYIKAELDLSKLGKSNLVIYGTQFAIDPNKRDIESNEILGRVTVEDKNKNVILAADFNGGTKTSKGAGSADLKKPYGFEDCFDLARLQEPYFTHWSGKVLDYILLKNIDLKISGCYLFYTVASDHMPVIVDLAY